MESPEYCSNETEFGQLPWTPRSFGLLKRAGEVIATVARCSRVELHGVTELTNKSSWCPACGMRFFITTQDCRCDNYIYIIIQYYT
jgi:NAD-dependent DNA ligase